MESAAAEEEAKSSPERKHWCWRGLMERAMLVPKSLPVGQEENGTRGPGRALAVAKPVPQHWGSRVGKAVPPSGDKGTCGG